MPKKLKRKKTKKLKKPVRRGLFNKGLVKLVAVAIVIGCGVLVITTEQDCSKKRLELAGISEKISEYEAENADLQRILDSGDLSGYMEKIAVEERGYAYPDERRFYDTSRD